MVLTDRQRADLHTGIYEYLLSRPGDAFQKAAAALMAADTSLQDTVLSTRGTSTNNGSKSTTETPLLEKKWTAIPRLQKKVLELERQAAQNAKIHAHRAGFGSTSSSTAADAAAGGGRRMLPRYPCTHTLKGHSLVVTAVAVHPVYTVAVSGSEDGTIKVSVFLRNVHMTKTLFFLVYCFVPYNIVNSRFIPHFFRST
jgi:platelet-activating factor acetylhydrolase IB subunit alpha